METTRHFIVMGLAQRSFGARVFRGAPLRNLVEDGFDFRFRLPKVATEMAASARLQSHARHEHYGRSAPRQRA